MSQFGNVGAILFVWRYANTKKIGGMGFFNPLNSMNQILVNIRWDLL